jgi:hypothetical protein
MQIDPNAATGILLPEPLWLALTIAVVAAVAGALAADLAGDSGHLERAKRETGGWALGFWANLIMGVVAAALLLALNPPAESWLSLIATAAAAGIGAEAIIQGYVAGPKQLAEAQTRLENTAAVVEELAVEARAAVGQPSIPGSSAEISEVALHRIEAMNSAVQAIARPGR